LDLMEYKAKESFERFGIPTVPGFVVGSVDELPPEGTAIPYPVVCKAQVPTGGRGKAGGIRFAEDRGQLETACRDILGLRIKGHPVEKLLVVGKVALQRELYLSLLLDRETKGPLLIFSAVGGMDIEAVAKDTPEKVLKVAIDPQVGVREYVARYLLSRAGLPDDLAGPLFAVLSDLYRLFLSCDCTLVEINPLALTADGRLIALDGKMSVDDSALSRQPDLLAYRDAQPEDALVLSARKAGFLYIPCDPDGDIAVMSNGSGMIMSSMDRIAQRGMTVRAALDLGGGATSDRIRQAIAIVLSDPRTQALFLNIFGGITRCDEVAAGVAAAVADLGPDRLLVVRFEGTNKEQGLAILAANPGRVVSADDLAEAVVALDTWRARR
jgi:succinyl-CoA synthetase beta subunit